MAASDLKDKRDGHLAIRDWKNGKRQRRGTSDPGVWCSLSGESTLQCAVLSDDLPHHPGLVDNTRHPNRRERRRLSRHIYFIYLFSSNAASLQDYTCILVAPCSYLLLVGLLARLLQLLNPSQDPSGQVQISQESSFGKEHPKSLLQLLYQCSQQGHMTVVEKLLPVSKTTWNAYDSRFHAHCKCQSRCQPKAYPSRAGVKFQGRI
ncbi:hypothetical protein V2W45_466728 [Cenococcum geophilum]